MVSIICRSFFLNRLLLFIEHAGVRTVDVNFEKSEVKVVGAFDSKKIHQRIEKLSKRKVEFLKVEENFKHTVVVEKLVKETKQVRIL